MSRFIRLVEPPKRQLRVDTPLQTALTIVFGAVLVIVPWLLAVWLHALVSQQIIR